ncbi:MAG: hypothetical protein CVT84_17155 [Alphaproteobacteria bacterium HGW-Alphaproteobacteria-6]|nr:MAG: hypothetical protein CVT84_17155 [Alphaproteobacteria bacterium HGW-Alphaproteobacteria-6]
MSDIDRSGLIRIARADPADATGAATAVEPLDLGRRVRALRRARGWTLQTAASAAGLARSTPSTIENGQMSPTYDALQDAWSG